MAGLPSLVQRAQDAAIAVAMLPADSPYREHDPKREFFFGDPRLVAAEVVLPDLRNSLLLGLECADIAWEHLFDNDVDSGLWRGEVWWGRRRCG
jgi:hypothetical protein